MLPIVNVVTTTLGKYQDTGDNPFSKTCGDGQVATGISMNSASKLDKINSITCKALGRIHDTAYAGSRKTIDSGGSGGTRYDLNCPANQALGSIYTGYHDLIDYADVRCVDIKTGAAGPKQIYGVMQDFNTKRTVPGHIISLAGRTGRYVDNLSVQSKNFSSIMAYLESPEGQLKCCMKEIPSDYCKFWGTTPGCDSFMNSYCAKPANAERGECACINSVELTGIPCPFKFNTKCINSGYQTSNMRSMVCPDFLQCNQINTLSDSALLLATRMEQNCEVNNTTNNNTTPPAGTNPPASGTTPPGTTTDNSGFDPPNTTPGTTPPANTPGSTTTNTKIPSNVTGSKTPTNQGISFPSNPLDAISPKILIIIFVVIAAVILGIGIYTLKKRKTNSNAPANYPQQPIYQQPNYQPQPNYQQQPQPNYQQPQPNYQQPNYQQ